MQTDPPQEIHFTRWPRVLVDFYPETWSPEFAAGMFDDLVCNTECGQPIFGEPCHFAPGSVPMIAQWERRYPNKSSSTLVDRPVFFQSNREWAKYLQNTIERYLAGYPLTDAEFHFIRAALEALGAPPEHIPQWE